MSNDVIERIEHPFCPEPQSLVVIGQIGAPYGVQGWHHVRSFTNPLENILSYKQWYIEQGGRWRLFQLVKGRLHGQALVAQLQGINDRDSAALLSLANIAIERAQLAPLSPDEFYWADLEGMWVQTVAGEKLGQLLYLYQNAGTDIMVIQNEDKEQQIPFVMHDTVVSVDLTAKLITVDWP